MRAFLKLTAEKTYFFFRTVFLDVAFFDNTFFEELALVTIGFLTVFLTVAFFSGTFFFSGFKLAFLVLLSAGLDFLTILFFSWETCPLLRAGCFLTDGAAVCFAETTALEFATGEEGR